MFWQKTKFNIGHTMVSIVLGKTMTLNIETIAQAIGCMREGSKYNSKWEQVCGDNVPRALYKDNAQKAQGKKVIYNLSCDLAMAKCSKQELLTQVGVQGFHL